MCRAVGAVLVAAVGRQPMVSQVALLGLPRSVWRGPPQPPPAYNAPTAKRSWLLLAMQWCALISAACFVLVAALTEHLDALHSTNLSVPTSQQKRYW